MLNAEEGNECTIKMKIACAICSMLDPWHPGSNECHAKNECHKCVKTEPISYGGEEGRFHRCSSNAECPPGAQCRHGQCRFRTNRRCFPFPCDK